MLIALGIAFPIQGMGRLLQAKLAQGFQQTKRIPAPKSFETYKKFLTEPWQFSDPVWRKGVLEPTLGSAIQTAMWASLSYAMGMPIYVIRLDKIAHGLKRSWQYAQSYFIPSTQDTFLSSDKNVPEIESPKKIDK